MRVIRILTFAFCIAPVFIFAAGRSPIIDAVKAGSIETLRAALKGGSNVNLADADGTTALHWASYRDDLESADLLIGAGANVNAANDLGATALWTAGVNGSAAMTRRLLAAGANPNLALLSGETPLMVAARSGCAACVEQLLARGATVDATATRGQTALMWAVSQRHPNVVKLLLAHRADISIRSDVWTQMMAVVPHGVPDYNRLIPHGGEDALMFAARVGDLESARLLVAAGAKVNDADAWGVSALVLAAHSGFGDLLDFLLEKGADPNSATAGFTALHEAVMRRDERMVAALLARGADPEMPLRTWTPARRDSIDFSFAPALVGASPFWLAARFAQPNVMRLLVTSGANPRFVHHADYYREDRNDHRTENITPLMAALGMGGGRAWVQPDRGQRDALILETVKLTLELGVDINAENTDGRTALDAAQALKLEPVIKLLVDSGARPGRPKKPAK